jgi:hypothetical protein
MVCCCADGSSATAPSAAVAALAFAGVAATALAAAFASSGFFCADMAGCAAVDQRRSMGMGMAFSEKKDFGCSRPTGTLRSIKQGK